MSSDNALSMQDAKRKLAKLEKHMPGASPQVCEFGRYLRNHLNPELVPQGFALACELALYDLQEGVDGFKGEPINNDLVGQHPAIFADVRGKFTDIASALFPAEFAAGVKSFFSEVVDKIEQDRMLQEAHMKQVVELMASSKSEDEWNVNCEKVKAANGGGLPGLLVRGNRPLGSHGQDLGKLVMQYLADRPFRVDNDNESTGLH